MIQNPTQSQGVDEIVDAVVSRIVNAGIGGTAQNTWVVVAPDDAMHDHLGEPGYRVRIGPPEPTKLPGAGRHGYLTGRRVDIFLVSENLADQGGRDNRAARKHLQKEDRLLDAMLLTPPTFPAPVSGVGDLFHLAGGTDITRALKTNPAIIASALSFVVTYVPRTTVNRE